LQWLKAEEWEEQPEVDEENQSSSTSFAYAVDDFSLQCFFECNERGEVFKLVMYFLDTKVPEKRLDEVQKLVTATSFNMRIGSLQLLPDKRVVRFIGGIDVEAASFDPQHITNLMSAATHTMMWFLPRYIAVCFGGKTAEEAMAEDEE
jgi:hypothetical protein